MGGSHVSRCRLSMSGPDKPVVAIPLIDDIEKHKQSVAATPSKRFFDDVLPFREEEIREALKREAKRHRWWKESAAKKMQIGELENSSCIQYVLESFTEARSTSEATEAYTLGQYLDRHGDDSGSSQQNPWDYEVMPNMMFVEQTRVMELPGSSRMGKCTGCSAEGSTHCFHCRGNGQDKCGFCRGTGMKSGVAHPAVYTHPMVASFPHADLSRGYASSSTAMVRHGNNTYGVGTPMYFMSKTGVPPPGLGTHDLCYMCHGRGVRECHYCKGGGKKVCSTCGGSGSVRSFSKLIVQFELEKSDYITPCEVPEMLIRQAESKEIFMEQANYVRPISKYHVKEVNENSRMLCVKHLERVMGKSRVIQQRHSLHAIPLCRVAFSLGNQTGVFWVYGRDARIYFPKYPSKCTIL
ncbi:hypothetical protein PENTCL1PPCAC_19274 [Pristionchus entomophagus]|uniref:Ssu-2 n=1 Tax=Pristionchus entomophagus TaxID=358040 RepID=A0AAV5TSB0_9BILA|nr:hypothetical protein PENTCL1PPCAC_19274 [Pristionchus entomophagus]